MKKLSFCFLFILITSSISYGQNESENNGPSKQEVKNYIKNEKIRVYHIRPYINYPIIVGGLIGNYFGVASLRHKHGLTYDQVKDLTPQDVNAFDRGASKQNPAVAKQAMLTSDYCLYASVLLPSFLAFDKKIRKDAYNVIIVYLTTMSIMSNAYSWGVGHINRYRPYVYNTEEDISRRTRNGSKNSFYAGHVAATATATFFIAKVYHDYNPGSKLTPFLFGAAVIPPAIVGYFRYRSGMHFPTDIIAGFTAGTAMGILIPQFHKFKKKNLSFYPAPYGVGMTARF